MRGKFFLGIFKFWFDIDKIICVLVVCRLIVILLLFGEYLIVLFKMLLIIWVILFVLIFI